MGIVRSAPLRAISSGLFYGAADGAIKASVGSGGHGGIVLLSGWAALALLGTCGGFLAFRSALRSGHAITAISLMNAVAALVALGCGLLGFGESLGRDPGFIAAYLVAVVLLLACVPVIVAAHTAMEETGSAASGTGRAWPDADRKSRERAAGSEQEHLDPNPNPRTPSPNHVGQPQVTRQRKRGVRSERQQRRAEHGRQYGSFEPSHVGQRESSHEAGR